jgi:hypothetical protein
LPHTPERWSASARTELPIERAGHGSEDAPRGDLLSPDPLHVDDAITKLRDEEAVQSALPLIISP